MASLSATITQDCASGGGRLTLTQATPGPGAGDQLTYVWAVVGADSTDYGFEFAPDSLPAYAQALPNGTFTSRVTATDADGNRYLSQLFSFKIACGPPLTLDSLTATGATATTGGTVTVQASGGTAPLTGVLVELNLSQALTSGQPATQPNIPAGTYTQRVQDSANPPQVVTGLVTVPAYVAAPVRGCTDPLADNYNRQATEDDDSCTYTPPVRVPYFDVPAMQSLRFVVPGSTIRPAFDNVLLADETPLDYANPGYCQPVEQADTLVLQALSNYQGAPALELRTAAGAVTRTVAGVRVQQGAGRTVSFEVYLKPDVVAGRTRVYFNEDSLPLPFLAGQRVTISTTGISLDGTYPIRDVLEDAAAAVPFLVLPVAYPAGTTRVDATLTTTYVVQAYDTYQFVVPFAGVPAGCYVARITADDNDFGRALAVSEPIDVDFRHAGTKLIAYRNFDNSNGLNYSAGLVNRLRVVARFFERQPATEKTVLRNDDGRLEILTASAYRKVELETLLLPGWLHEQLAVAFCHDFVKVGPDRWVLEGEYAHEPVQRYTLARGTALLEAYDFLGAGNRDDLGDTDVDAGGGPFLLANERYLKVNL